MSAIRIRQAGLSEHGQLLLLNESELPHVSTLDTEAFAKLAAMSVHLGVAEGAQGELAGFVLAFDEKANYSSMNFQWFRARYPSFVYVDRIVVSAAFRGQGVGRLLYEDLAGHFRGRVPLMTCEVNLRPPNPGSMEFHRKLGFEQVGQQDTEQGKKTVAMLVKNLPQN